jgi:hypothetical protein
LSARTHRRRPRGHGARRARLCPLYACFGGLGPMGDRPMPRTCRISAAFSGSPIPREQGNLIGNSKNRGDRILPRHCLVSSNLIRDGGNAGTRPPVSEIGEIGIIGLFLHDCQGAPGVISQPSWRPGTGGGISAARDFARFAFRSTVRVGFPANTGRSCVGVGTTAFDPYLTSWVTPP